MKFDQLLHCIDLSHDQKSNLQSDAYKIQLDTIRYGYLDKKKTDEFIDEVKLQLKVMTKSVSFT